MSGQVQIGDYSFVADNPIGVTFGINTGPAYKNAGSGLSDQLFIDAAALGLSRIRFNIVREAVEPAQGQFDWSTMDHLVEQANKKGIRATLIARGYPGSGPPSWAADPAGPCSGAGGPKTYTTASAYAEYAVALCQRYSGDGNPKNAKASDGSGHKLQADCIEIGNEDFNVGGGGSNPDNGGCSDALRYVFYVRQIIPQMRKPVAQGGGGWVPRGNFLARIGQWGHLQTRQQTSNVSQARAAVQDAWHKMCNPNYDTSDPKYSTWNPSGSGNSIFGFDSKLGYQMLDYANFHNYSDIYNPATLGNPGGYDHAQELDDIRAILNAAGNTNTPIWCTESGEDGPAGGGSASKQSTFYAANNDGTGIGALATLKAHGCQHFDLFTINYAVPGTPPYTGEIRSVACKDSSSPSGYVRFQAFTTIQNYFTNVDKGAWAAQPIPKGFGGGNSPPPPPPPPPSGVKYPLPGQKFVNNVSTLIFGSNLAQDFATNTVRNTPAIQAAIKQANFQVMRCAIPVSSSNAYIDSVIAACTACGCLPLVILSGQAANASWNTSLVTYLGSKCLLYEFGNEPDLGGISQSTYTTNRNTQIPSLRGINTSAAFIGPALGVFANLNSYLVPWLTAAVAAGNTPDGVSYHVYPCTDPSTTQTQCAPKSGNFANDAATVRAAIAGVTSTKLALCLTEWNIDATNPPKSYAYDPTFNPTWTKAAIDSMVAGNLDMACQWDAGSNAGGGKDDLVSTQFPYPTQVQYAPMADRITFYLGGGTPPPTGSGSLTGSFAAQGSGTINLTSEGVSDWAHWNGTTFDHKSSGGTQISNFVALGNGVPAANPNAVVTSVWSDGTPDASGNTQTGTKVVPPAQSTG